MRLPVILYAAPLLLLFSLHEEKVTAQIVNPNFYGGAPIQYVYDENNDDDIGLLLAVLLLASRNRGGGGCCCNCNNVKTVPVPFPIPFPTNNAIIRQKIDNDDESDKKDGPTQVINVDNENDDEAKNQATNKSNSKSDASASSSSGSSSASSSGGGIRKHAKGKN